jgi:hypothetical protein
MAKNLREIKYACLKCGAVDTVRLYDHEGVPPAVNCWKCHSGYGKPVDEMLGLEMGMRPQLVKKAA